MPDAESQGSSPYQKSLGRRARWGRAASIREPWSWYFEVELHDDDWWNADHEPLERLLTELPLPSGRGIVISREAWKGAPSDVVLVTEGGGVVSKMIADEASEDGDVVTVEQATQLVRAMKWPRAAALFESFTEGNGAAACVAFPTIGLRLVA